MSSSSSVLPPLVVLAGSPLTGRWVWAGRAEERPAVPAGILVDHGDHTTLIAWAAVPGLNDGRSLFSLESLKPLTVVEPAHCGTCGLSGRIEQGAWLPMKVG